MYLTAHHIKSSKTDEPGINAFLYKHGDRPIPGVSWDSPDVERIADELPGELVAESVDVPPGGNAVVSYLDVVSDDAMPHEVIETVVRSLEKRASDSLPFVAIQDRVAVRFGSAQFGGADPIVEFRKLADRALSLLEAPDEAWKRHPPIDLFVETTADGYRYSLDPNAVERVKKYHEFSWTPCRISISYDVRRQFQDLWGDFDLRELVPLLTGLQLQEVVKLGGVRFHSQDTGKIIWEWPARDGHGGENK